MYSYDPTEAFGSWCVKGAGADPHVPIWRAARDFSEEEQHYITDLLAYSDLELFDMLTLEQHPRWQRIIQKMYEYKRWVRARRG